MKCIAWASALFIIFFFLSSCIIAVVDYSEPSAFRLQEEFHKILSLDSGGTLFLENTNGNIEIHGWERNEVEIFAVKRILRPTGRKVQWYSMSSPLPKIDIDEFNDSIKIRTLPSRWKNDAGLVDYYINVPQLTHLKKIMGKDGDVFLSDFYGKASLELVNGDVEVDNFSGSLLISIMNGEVKATLYDLREEDEIRISTNQGDIAVFLQSGANAQIKARAPNGNIFSEFVFKESLPAEKISEQIGENGAIISLTSLNGDVRINKF